MSAATPSDVAAIQAALAAPFPDDQVKWKPAIVKGERALALCYVDARVIADRLDEVLGVAGWQDEYEFLPDGSCMCRLRLRLGDEWVTKMDVGGASEQPDEGDRHKAAVSDALKRAAVKFGVGRYLYRVAQQWVEYDPQRKKFLKTPRLPAPARAVAARAPAPAGPAEVVASFEHRFKASSTPAAVNAVRAELTPALLEELGTEAADALRECYRQALKRTKARKKAAPSEEDAERAAIANS